MAWSAHFWTYLTRQGADCSRREPDGFFFISFSRDLRQGGVGATPYLVAIYIMEMKFEIYPGSSTHVKVVCREILHPIELEFGNVGFWEEGKTGELGEKALGAEYWKNQQQT